MTNFSFKSVAATTDLVQPPIWQVGNTHSSVRWQIGNRQYFIELIDATKDPAINPAARNPANDFDPTNGHNNWQLVNETQVIPWDINLIGYFWSFVRAGGVHRVSVGRDSNYAEHITLSEESLNVADFADSPDINSTAYRDMRLLTSGLSE